VGAAAAAPWAACAAGLPGAPARAAAAPGRARAQLPAAGLTACPAAAAPPRAGWPAARRDDLAGSQCAARPRLVRAWAASWACSGGLIAHLRLQASCHTSIRAFGNPGGGCFMHHPMISA